MMMDQIWEELRKIEKEVAQIHSETLEKSKQIINFAKDKSEKLISDSKILANEEANELLESVRKLFNKENELDLAKNRERAVDSRKLAEARMNKAVQTIFDSVLGKD